MKNIIVTPYPNYKVADNAMSNDVIPNSRKAPKILNTKQDDNLMVAITTDTIDRHRFNFALPININGEAVMTLIPEPTKLFLDRAIMAINNTIEIKYKLITTESRKTKGTNVRMVNSITDETNKMGNLLFQEMTNAVILMVIACESFINKIIPDDAKIEKRVKKKIKQIGKKEIEEGCGFREKLRNVIPQTKEIKFSEEQELQITKILDLYNIRKSLVHIKTHRKNKFEAKFLEAYQRIIDLDYEDYATQIIDFMNSIETNYIVYSE